VSPPGELFDVAGRRFHVVRGGQGSPLVVLESGGGGGASMQDWPILERVSAFTRCFSYDRAGLGWSDPAPPQPRSFDAMARDLAGLLDVAGEAPPYVLAAISFGGLPARRFAALFPDRVAGMVLIDAAEEQEYFSTIPGFRSQLEAELQAAAGAAQSTRPHYEGSLRELEAIDTVTPEQRRAGGFGLLGDRPLVVLSHGRPWEGDYAVWEAGFAASQQRLAGLSSRSAHVVARAHGHSIGVENPHLAAAAVRAVVNAVRGGELDMAEVRALAGQERQP
jgi:pimeloyl-ACP methyl ester carboxylesterase